MNILYFKTDNEKINKGVWIGFDITNNCKVIEVESKEELPHDFGFCVAPITDIMSQVEVDKINKETRKKFKLKQGEEMTMECYLEITKRVIAELMIKDWHNVDIGDEKNVPFNRDNALRAINYAYDNNISVIPSNIYYFCQNQSNFILKDKYDKIENLKKN